MESERPATASRDWIVALLAGAAGVVLRIPLDPVLGHELPYVTIFGGLAVAIWFTRWRPAAFSAALSLLAAEWLFVWPYRAALDAQDLIGIGGFAVSVGAIIAVGEAMHRARGAAEREIERCRELEQNEREQKEILRVTLASIGDGVIVTDAKGNVVSLNPEAERLTGWTTADAKGLPLAHVFAIINEETRGAVESPVDKVFRLGTVVGLANHTLLLSKSGAETPIHDSAAPITRDGAVLGVVLVFRDATEERRANRNAARLAAIVEHSGDAIVTKNLSGIIQSWNKSAEALFGYAADEAIGQPITMVVPPERMDEETMILSRIRDGRTVERIETVRRTKDGRAIPVAVSVSPIRDPDGKVIGASKIAHDISEVVAVREAFAREKELLETTLASIGDAVITTDADGKITFLNAVAEWVTGWKNDEAEGRPLGEVFRIINEETRRAAENPALRSLRDGVIVGLANHTLLVRKDGSERPIDDSAAPIRASDGSVVGCVLVFRDITERRQSERNERTARLEAEQASRLKDEFLATLSHELRTPLNAILGWSRLIDASPTDLETIQRGAQVITRNAKAQADLIDDLLDMSRIISGKLRLEIQQLDLADAIHAGIDAIRHSAESKGIEIQEIVRPVATTVRGDPGRLQQVVWNLLSNAVKFTPRGGRIQVLLVKKENHAEIVVSDTGIGIRAEFLPHLFERFRQLDASPSRQHGGLGLGLAIVKNLVELHGGDVRVESEGEGKGSTFIVELPLSLAHPQRPPAPQAEADAVPDDVDLRGVSILVVDDEPDTRDLLLRVLGERNAHVTPAGSADEAMQRFREMRPHLVLCDIGMPDVDGYEFIRRLRSSGDATPAVAVTAFARAEDRLRALRAGYQGHITKPVEPSELLATVTAFAKPLSGRVPS